MRHRAERRLSTLLLVAVALSLLAAAPVTAVVRRPAEPMPSPIPAQAGGRVEVAWAGIAITFPDAWVIRLKRPPTSALEGGAAVLVATGPGSAICTLDLFDPHTVERWEDVGVEAVEWLAIAGTSAARYDDMWGGGTVGVSSYTVFAPTIEYVLFCMADVAPPDRWWSIADTIELMPAERVSFRADP